MLPGQVLLYYSNKVHELNPVRLCHLPGMIGFSAKYFFTCDTFFAIEQNVKCINSNVYYTH